MCVRVRVSLGKSSTLSKLQDNTVTKLIQVKQGSQCQAGPVVNFKQGTESAHCVRAE